MADTEDLICFEKLSASDGNTGVDGVKFGETFTAFAEWQRRAKADQKISDCSLRFEIEDQQSVETRRLPPTHHFSPGSICQERIETGVD